jgi:hypothetical protein
MNLTAANRRALAEIARQGGEVSCSSFARGMYGTHRSAYAAGNVLTKLKDKGLLTRRMEFVGSAHAVHYKLTDLGREHAG